MKRFILLTLILTFMMGAFAKQKVYCYKYQPGYTIEPQISEMISYGWKVVTITPVIQHRGNSSTTDYIIVVYEKEE